ncbi:MAG: hypothetical protein ACMUHU_00880 [Thermoplasmatota archaeon]
MTVDSEEIRKDRKQTSSDINQIIADKLKRSKRVKITGLTGHNNIAVGLDMECEINISGQAGDLLGAFNNGAILLMDGSCGDLAGDTLLKGGIIIIGNCGRRTGASIQNGIVVVKGNCGAQAGIGMEGGTLIIDGNVDGDLAPHMADGTIIVTGNVKGGICPDSTGGTIFVGGEIGSGLENVEKVETTSKDSTKLSKYFDHYGISAVPSTIRKYRAGVLL